jgi:hypothetical protein
MKATAMPKQMKIVLATSVCVACLLLSAVSRHAAASGNLPQRLFA